jgi:hypothetical protein
MSDTEYTIGVSSKSVSASPHQPDEPTLLAKLRERVSTKVSRAEVLVEVPERPNVTVRVSPNITQNQMRAWRRNAGEDTKAGFDPTVFACYVIGHTTTGIFIDDEEVFDEAGNSLTFASPIVKEMTDTTRPIPDAVRAFFGLDPHVEGAALAIMEKAGYSDTVDAVDPTKTS